MGEAGNKGGNSFRMKKLIIHLIRAYQVALSPALRMLGGAGSGCRFEPSCSAYCLQAVELHGSIKGLRLGFLRICRCHPWGPSGFDPVPTIPAIIHKN